MLGRGRGDSRLSSSSVCNVIGKVDMFAERVESCDCVKSTQLSVEFRYRLLQESRGSWEKLHGKCGTGAES